MTLNVSTRLSLLVALLASATGLASAAPAVAGSTDKFELSSPDIAPGSKIDDKFVLNGFGCKGGNISPALQWKNAPAGTKSFVLQVYDPDAPTGSGFWHWTVNNIPANVTQLTQGAGNAPANLPAGAYGGVNDFQDTGATGGNGNYGGPCPPAGDKPHRYEFSLFALAVDDIDAAAGVPKTGTAALHGFVLNKGLGDKLLGKASFTAAYGH
ncbi:YbhB/YbcL family Raf kinase inhibitor-like protein [Rhizobium pisi]|uniref:YbhB/YbcL family Raf kinase inhibitor-like protein n=1 Tax=Rhizobium TaxID=379 RepID=UPI00102F2ED2|nr:MULTISPECIES: YbhB/YbcL family Raf kinase inhibitor-like protein [Rhizobium]MBY5806458.1 YbhB/YbcL family Raf kinase inhibitor-like protein [Rhizobium leguminosarum]TBE73961.1 YbhB/YbcL family Raf kinase inhibitor-like protein [Rhizobium leguminosarum]TCA60949.1 YbhB/YbcL family Raf kinase inhibitor-like protein [Rhizobium pisi]